jgi:hypothetical protein
VSLVLRFLTPFLLPSIAFSFPPPSCSNWMTPKLILHLALSTVDLNLCFGGAVTDKLAAFHGPDPSQTPGINIVANASVSASSSLNIL